MPHQPPTAAPPQKKVLRRTLKADPLKDFMGFCRPSLGNRRGIAGKDGAIAAATAQVVPIRPPQVAASKSAPTAGPSLAATLAQFAPAGWAAQIDATIGTAHMGACAPEPAMGSEMGTALLPSVSSAPALGPAMGNALISAGGVGIGGGLA